MDYALGLSNFNVVPKKEYQINKKLVGQRLKEIRKENDLTQILLHDFAAHEEDMRALGLGDVVSDFYELCKKLNVSADYITGRSNTKKIYINDK